MDYEKLYKESLEKAKAFAAKYVGDGLLISSEGSVAKEFNEIFQELRESEDERIRKMLIELVKKHLVNHERCMAESWLEKQGEQKKIDYDEELKKCKDNPLYFFDKYVTVKLKEQGEQKPIEQDTEINDLWVYIKEWREKFGRLPKDEDELAACIDYVMKRQKPAEWSEDDEMFLFNIIKDLERLEKESKIEQLKDVYSKEINWLKLRKPQKHWKPSEQNIKDLEWCADLVKDKMGVGFHRLQVFIDEIKNI